MKEMDLKICNKLRELGYPSPSQNISAWIYDEDMIFKPSLEELIKYNASTLKNDITIGFDGREHYFATGSKFGGFLAIDIWTAVATVTIQMLEYNKG